VKDDKDVKTFILENLIENVIFYISRHISLGTIFRSTLVRESINCGKEGRIFWKTEHVELNEI